MRQNVFLGDGPFGSRQVAGIGLSLGQAAYPVNYPDPYATVSKLIDQIKKARAEGDEEMENFYQQQLDAMGARDWYPWLNERLSEPLPPPPPPPPSRPPMRTGNIPQYSWTRPTGQPTASVDRMRSRQDSLQRFGFSAFNMPGATTYAPMMSGRIPVENPDLIG